MKRFAFGVIFLSWAASCLAAGLPRSKPEAQGVSPAAVLELVEALDGLDSVHSLMLVRHGQVVAEGWWAPYRAEARHMLYSLSKSFTSTAVGLAAAEGKLSVDDPVLKFFPDDAPAEPSKNLQAMRLSDLLRMSTGQQSEPARTTAEPWVKTFLAHPVPFKPGTHFLYNTSATYMQSAIVQKATGQTVLDYLQSRLFQPLGIEDPTWELSPQGIATGGYGLSVRTEDIAKFGQLYLQKGNWQGKQLVPSAWIEAATSRQTSNGSNPQSDWDQGYGYQFWRCRNGAYRGDGAFGQYCLVLPQHDAVLAITSGLGDMQAVLNQVWDKLLPGLAPSEVPADDRASGLLRQKLATLGIPTPTSGAASTPIAGGVYSFPANDLKLESLTVKGDAQASLPTLLLRVEGVDYTLACGNGKWIDGKAAIGQLKGQPVAAAAAWTADGLLAKLCFYETPYIVTLRLKPTDAGLAVRSEMNVNFGPTKFPELVGKLAAP